MPHPCAPKLRLNPIKKSDSHTSVSQDRRDGQGKGLLSSDSKRTPLDRECLLAVGLAALLLSPVATTPVHAQVVPGVTGGVQNPDANRGVVRSAKLIDNETGQTRLVLPLNGLLNYVFYYEPLAGSTTADQFLQEQQVNTTRSYTVEYLDGGGGHVGAGCNPGSPCVVNYTPNSGFLSPAPVSGQPLNRFPDRNGDGQPDVFGALGIQGQVRGKYGTVLQNASVVLNSNSTGQRVDLLNFVGELNPIGASQPAPTVAS